MKQLLFITIALLLLNTACQQNETSEATSPTSTHPNILFIMSDDHAERAISAYGSELILTPNIDRIAQEGVLFRNSFVTNSICAPSRAVMLTGKYSHLNGLRDNRDVFDGSQLTFPKLLQEAGYQTGIVGKWHLKTEPTGFDYYNILINQGYYYNPILVENGDTSQQIGYTTDLITDYTLEYLENRDTTKPFCLLYHHKAPHRNWMPEPDHFAMYADEDLPLPDNFFDEYEGRPAAAQQDMRISDMFLSNDMKLQPDAYDKETGTGGGPESYDPERDWANAYGRMTEEQQAAWDAHYEQVNEAFKNANLSGEELDKWKYQRYLKDYLRVVKSVDENIGRVLDYLDENGLAENTIVVYTSDQGFYLGEHGWYDKRFIYEESLSMPLVMRYPAAVEAGQINDSLVLNLDFAPTFLDYAGVEIPAEMQGQSLRPLIEQEGVTAWRDGIYYHYYEYPHGWHSVKRHYGIRTYRYKLIHFYNDIDHWELYDLQEDPSEMNNLYGNPEYADIQERLHAQLKDLQEQYQDEVAM